MDNANDNKDRKFCLDLTEDELTAWCLDNGYPKFRAGQIMKWLSSGITDVSGMTNIPKTMRDKLSEDFIFSDMKIVDEFISEIDGTRKLVYLLPD